MMLTRNGWTFVAVMALCAAVGLWLSYGELVVVALALLLCLVLAALWPLMRPKLDVVREVTPHRVSEGDGAAGIVTVTNVARRRCRAIEATDELVGGIVKVSI